MILLAAAWADCPDPAAVLRGVEQDTLDVYLADAQVGLGRVLEALACSGPVEPALHRRYFQAQAMIWAFQPEEARDEAQIRAALLASRLREQVWGEETWGAAVPEHAVWEGLLPSEADPVPLEVRGRAEDEKLWVDGQPTEVPAWVSPGMHLLQVGRPDAMRVARTIDVTGPVTVRIPRRPAPAPEPVAAPDPTPVEEPEPVAEPEPAPVVEPEPEPPPAPEPAPKIEVPRVRLLVTPSRQIPLQRQDGVTGELCVRTTADGKCKAPKNGEVKLGVTAGLAPLEVVGESGGALQLYWVDGSPPVPGQVEVVARPEHVEVVPVAFAEPESWILRYLLATTPDCAAPDADSTEGPLRIPWTAVESGARHYLCAVNAAGLVSTGVRVPDARFPEGRQTTTTLQERVEAVGSTQLVVPQPASDGPVCSSTRPGCTPKKTADEVGDYEVRARGAGVYAVFSSFERDGAARTGVRYYLLDTYAPADGRVETVRLGSATALTFVGFEDRHSAIEGFRVALSDAMPPLGCEGPSVDVREPWVLVPEEAGYTHARVCAIDSAGQASRGVPVILR